MKTAGKLKKSLLTRRKRWISLLNSAEICKKHSVTQVNFHLYHYAGNNPIKYTDPDGRDTALAKDKKDAMGMGHMGVCVQTGEKTWSYFEVYAFDKNGKQAYQHVKVDEIRETTILSKNDMVIPTGVSGGHEAGVIQRDFESYEAMVEYLKKREFSELLYFETTPEQDKIIFDSAVDKGKGFSGYNLFGNNCGTWAMDVLSVKGSGISKYNVLFNLFFSVNNSVLIGGADLLTVGLFSIYYFNAPNGSWNIFRLSNPDAKVVNLE